MRVHPGAAGGGESQTRDTGSEYSCFGVHLNDVPTALALAGEMGLRFTQVHVHIGSGGDPEKVSEGHRLLLWGIIAFVVMISIWGLVNVVANTFGLAGAYAPPTPSSISPYGSTVQQGTGQTLCDSSGSCVTTP